MILVQNLCKYYGRYHAVNDISFDVKEGDIVGFLGPNGAGKTTTIRVLTCYHPATRGLATVNGFDVFHQSRQVRQSIGYLPESVPLYTEMRVNEYLDFRGKLRGLTRRQRKERIAHVLKRCWLEEMARRPIAHLSKGYRQRVGLADTLLHNPKVLILDEPTVGLDPTQIRETRSLIKELAADHTLMFSSHILPEVEATCKRLVIINRGKLIASGEINQLREQVASDARIIFEVQAPSDDLRSAILELNGVSELSIETRDAWQRATLRSDSDLRAPLGALAQRRNWPLRELRRETLTLEEFFVSIVAGASEQTASSSSARTALSTPEQPNHA